jgi:hypothetical protein
MKVGDQSVVFIVVQSEVFYDLLLFMLPRRFFDDLLNGTIKSSLFDDLYLISTLKDYRSRATMFGYGQVLGEFFVAENINHLGQRYIYPCGVLFVAKIVDAKNLKCREFCNH